MSLSAHSTEYSPARTSPLSVDSPLSPRSDRYDMSTDALPTLRSSTHPAPWHGSDAMPSVATSLITMRTLPVSIASILFAAPGVAEYVYAYVTPSSPSIQECPSLGDGITPVDAT